MKRAAVAFSVSPATAHRWWHRWLDASEYVRFKQPGHRVTSDRRSQDHSPDGIDHVHAVIDDRSRLAYAEVLDDAKAETAAGFLQRALAFYAAHVGDGARSSSFW